MKEKSKCCNEDLEECPWDSRYSDCSFCHRCIPGLVINPIFGETSGTLPPKTDNVNVIDETEKCYLIYTDELEGGGYLTCTYNHSVGGLCLMMEKDNDDVPSPKVASWEEELAELWHDNTKMDIATYQDLVSEKFFFELKSFISSTIKEERERLIGEVERKKYYNPYWVISEKDKAKNDLLQDIINLIKSLS